MVAQLNPETLDSLLRQGLTYGKMSKVLGYEQSWIRKTCKQLNLSPPSAKERFLRHVVKTDYCWLWKSYKTDFGHGRATVNGKSIFAHRHSYTLYKGPIPDGLIVRHTCDNPCCVNPEHLITGTKADNTRDMMERGRHRVGTQPIITQCKHGHLYTDENTAYNPKTQGRICKTCRKIRNDARPRKSELDAR